MNRAWLIRAYIYSPTGYSNSRESEYGEHREYVHIIEKAGSTIPHMSELNVKLYFSDSGCLWTFQLQKQSMTHTQAVKTLVHAVLVVNPCYRCCLVLWVLLMCSSEALALCKWAKRSGK